MVSILEVTLIMEYLDCWNIEKLFNCFQIALWTCLKKNIEPEILFINRFGLDYIDNKQFSISEKIKPLILGDIKEVLDNLFGVIIDEINIDECFLRDSNNYDYIVNVDAYYCRWNPFYKKNHISHYFILKDESYFDSERGFICEDPYLMKKNVYLSVDCLKKGFLSGTRIYKNKKDRKYFINKDVIKRYLFDSIDKKRLIYNYNQVINDLLNANHIEAIIENFDAKLCTGIIVSKQISNNYVGVKRIIERASDYSNGKELLIGKLEESSDIWKSINLHMIKLIYRSSQYERTCEVLIKLFRNLKNNDCDIIDCFYGA